VTKDDGLEQRLVDFAVRMIKLCAYLPQTQAGQHLAGQLLRSGAAPAAHYVEAWSAASDQESLRQLQFCLQELNLSRLWLTIITKSELLTTTQLENITAENDELCRLVSAGLKT